MKIKGYNAENVSLLEGEILFFKQVKGKYISQLYGGLIELDGKEMRQFKSLSKDKSNKFTMDMLNYIPFVVVDVEDLTFTCPTSDITEHQIKLEHREDKFVPHGSSSYETYTLGSHLKVSKCKTLNHFIVETTRFNNSGIEKPTKTIVQEAILLPQYLVELEKQLELSPKQMDYIYAEIKPLVVAKKAFYTSDYYSVFINLEQVIKGLERYELFAKQEEKYGSSMVTTNGNVHMLNKGQELEYIDGTFYILPTNYKSFKAEGFENGKYLVDTDEIPNVVSGLMYAVKEKEGK